MLNLKFNGLKDMWFFSNRLQILTARLFFRDTKLMVYRFGKLEFIMDHSSDDASSIRSIIAGDSYRVAIKKEFEK